MTTTTVLSNSTKTFIALSEAMFSAPGYKDHLYSVGYCDIEPLALNSNPDGSMQAVTFEDTDSQFENFWLPASSKQENYPDLLGVLFVESQFNIYRTLHVYRSGLIVMDSRFRKFDPNDSMTRLRFRFMHDMTLRRHQYVSDVITFRFPNIENDIRLFPGAGKVELNWDFRPWFEDLDMVEHIEEYTGTNLLEYLKAARCVEDTSVQSEEGSIDDAETLIEEDDAIDTFVKNTIEVHTTGSPYANSLITNPWDKLNSDIETLLSEKVNVVQSMLINLSDKVTSVIRYSENIDDNVAEIGSRIDLQNENTFKRNKEVDDSFAKTDGYICGMSELMSDLNNRLITSQAWQREDMKKLDYLMGNVSSPNTETDGLPEEDVSELLDTVWGKEILNMHYGDGPDSVTESEELPYHVLLSEHTRLKQKLDKAEKSIASYKSVIANLLNEE